MFKKALYLIFGLVIGFAVANIFSIPESKAQWGAGVSGGFTEEKLTPAVPARYGTLVGIEGVNLYFQAKDGTVYMMKQRTSGELDPRVTVVTRGQ